jgi:hypothetical protein
LGTGVAGPFACGTAAVDAFACDAGVAGASGLRTGAGAALGGAMRSSFFLKIPKAIYRLWSVKINKGLPV